MDPACNICKNEIVQQPVVICWSETDEMIIVVHVPSHEFFLQGARPIWLVDLN